MADEPATKPPKPTPAPPPPPKPTPAPPTPPAAKHSSGKMAHTPTPAGHLSAQELLSLGETGREPPFLNKIWPHVVGTFFGVGSGVFLNFQTRRPVFSGIQKHVLLTAGFVGTLIYVQKRRDIYLAEKDAVYRHYIELHPEDFPVPERRKIGDIFEPWIPVR